MEYVITVFKRLKTRQSIPIAQIQWEGDPPSRPRAFAKERGGDFIEVQSLDEYLELDDRCNLI